MGNDKSCPGKCLTNCPGNSAPMFYPCLCTLFCDKNGNFAHIYKFSLHTKHKTADKTLECSTFPEGIQGHMPKLW